MSRSNSRRMGSPGMPNGGCTKMCTFPHCTPPKSRRASSPVPDVRRPLWSNPPHCAATRPAAEAPRSSSRNARTVAVPYTPAEPSTPPVVSRKAALAVAPAATAEGPGSQRGLETRGFSSCGFFDDRLGPKGCLKGCLKGLAWRPEAASSSASLTNSMSSRGSSSSSQPPLKSNSSPRCPWKDVAPSAGSAAGQLSGAAGAPATILAPLRVILGLPVPRS
mmetsp:Transcript_31642/g.71125  ORF Transcript_31642/g.71125 Transcript_31642/m.71125 type:complete len:220 (-) Transcript_31642:2075-2734(-)